MGDRRFAWPYQRIRDAADRAQALHDLSDREVVEALAHASREHDPLLANVLATEASNRMERARAIFENMADGLCSVDAQGRIISINPAAERMLGWPHNDLVGKDKHETIHHQDDRGRPLSKEKCQMLRVLESGRVARSARDVFTRKDGTTFPISFTAAPVEVDGEVAGMVIAFRDITEQMAFEQEKTSWLNLVDAVYHVHDELGIGTLIVDDGRIHYANDAFRGLLGYSLDQLKAEVADVFALFPSGERESFKAHLADLYIHGSSRRARTAKLLRRDGSTVHVEVWVAKVNHQPGGVSRLVFVVRPV
ncbi:MAG TPA: PAS domain S-box protein [Candidatus Thermoplasmatota archaeon]|nr:PAS domain S-box protein [Candidatus Thermoplasmatota archaeon]